MYRIYMLQYASNSLVYEPLIIYDDENSNPAQKLVSPVLTLEDNAAGSLTFTMTLDNVGYDRISVLKSTVVVKRRAINPSPSDEPWDNIWEGRVISETRDFFNLKSITCEGALTYLHDLYVLQWDTFELGPRDVAVHPFADIQFKRILKVLLQNFNNNLVGIRYNPGSSTQQVNIQVRNYDRRIFLNEDDIPLYYGEKPLDFSSQCQTVLDYIFDSIIDPCGGHVKIIKRPPTNGEGADMMVPDPTDEVQTDVKKGLCLEYVEEYYTPDISEFSSQAYSKGDHTIYDGKVYRFIQNHSANTAFNSNEVEQIPHVKVSKIVFKKNLIDITKDYDGTDWYTAVLVTGGANAFFDDGSLHIVQTDNYDSLDPSQQTHNRWRKGTDSVSTMATDLSRPSVSGFPTAIGPSPLRFEDESINEYTSPVYIVNRAAAYKYGLIASHESANGQIADDDEDEEESQLIYSGTNKLYGAGVDFLKMHDPESYSIDVTALDFNFVDHSEPFANIGDLLYVDSSIHGLDSSLYFILKKMTIPLDSPESTTFTLNRRVSRSASALSVHESRFLREGGTGFGYWDTTGPDDPDPDTPVPELPPNSNSDPEPDPYDDEDSDE